MLLSVTIFNIGHSHEYIDKIISQFQIAHNHLYTFANFHRNILIPHILNYVPDKSNDIAVARGES